jgi:hypothetical protein
VDRSRRTGITSGFGRCRRVRAVASLGHRVASLSTARSRSVLPSNTTLLFTSRGLWGSRLPNPWCPLTTRSGRPAYGRRTDAFIQLGGVAGRPVEGLADPVAATGECLAARSLAPWSAHGVPGRPPGHKEAGDHRTAGDRHQPSTPRGNARRSRQAWFRCGRRSGSHSSVGGSLPTLSSTCLRERASPSGRTLAKVSVVSGGVADLG